MVSSYLQLLENKYNDDLDSDAQEYIEFAVDGADRMRTMIDDLLAYSRIDQKDPEFAQVDCNSVLSRIESDLQVQIAEADAEIVTESLPTVVADEKQLEQLFQNLLSNAIKYRDEDPPRILISAEEQGDCWKFSVDDNGIGIEPEHADQIFEVFNRLHNDDRYQGTGVGLSLCQKIVARHGGRIWVDSELDEGSTFYFTLPKKAPPHQDIVI